MEEIEKIYRKIQNAFDEFTGFHLKAGSGIKSAETKARKCSNDLTKLLKSYRAISLHKGGE